MVEQLGGKSTPAVGFALGMERLVFLLESNADLSLAVQDPTASFIVSGEKAQQQGLALAEKLRDIFKGINIDAAQYCSLEKHNLKTSRQKWR